MAKKITQIEINGETYNINGGGGGSAGDALKQVSNMATYTPTDGEIVQYIGATTADYVHAGIYEYGVNMKTFAVGANKSGIPQGIYRTKASPTAMNLYVSGFNGSDGNTYHSAYYSKLRVGDVMWNISTAESFYITAVNSETSYELENGVTATFSGSTYGGSIQVYEIDGYYFFDYSVSSIFTRAGYDVRSGFLMVGDVGEEFNNFTSTVFSGWFQLNQIGEGDVTVKKHGATVQTFNVNQQWNTIIDLPDDVRMAHFNSGKAFIVEVTECVQINGEFFDPQKLIDNPDDPRPFIPIDGEYYYATNIDRVYSYDDYEGVVDVTDTVLISGNPNVLYVDVDTNQSFRYNGTAFVKITDSSKADDVPTFTEAATRANLAGSGESTLTLWGKVKKFFADLKAVAFSGSYNDLTNKPDLSSYIKPETDPTTQDTYVNIPNDTSIQGDAIVHGDTFATDFVIVDPNYSLQSVSVKSKLGDLKTVATSGSYNDLSNKPLSVESSKVKYTLSDGITKLTLAQESDLFSKDYNDLTSKPSKNYVLGTNVPLITTEVGSKYYTFSSDLETGTQYKVIFDMIISSALTFSTRNPIYIYYNSGSFLWIVSSGTYQAGEYHIEKIVNVPNSFTNARFSLTANDSEFVGKITVRNLRFEKISENGWKPNISDEMVDFTSSAVSGNIASGETLAVMTKKISQYFTVVDIFLTPTSGEKFSDGFKRMIVQLTTLYPTLSQTTGFLIYLTFYNKIIVQGGAYSSTQYANVDGHYYYCNFTAQRLLGSANKIYQFGWEYRDWYYREI